MKISEIQGIHGRLDAFAETGTEGVIPSIYENGKVGYAALRSIKNGDYLIIHKNEEIIWQGVVETDYKTHAIHPYGQNENCLRIVAFGYYIHWIQKGFEPEEWMQYFFPEKDSGDFGHEAILIPRVRGFKFGEIQFKTMNGKDEVWFDDFIRLNDAYKFELLIFEDDHELARFYLPHGISAPRSDHENYEAWKRVFQDKNTDGLKFKLIFP